MQIAGVEPDVVEVYVKRYSHAICAKYYDLREF